MGKKLTTEALSTQRYDFFVCRETAANENRCSAFGGMRFLSINSGSRELGLVLDTKGRLEPKGKPAAGMRV